MIGLSPEMPRRMRGQQGGVLMLVLAVLVVGTVVLAALMSFVFTNLVTTRAYRNRTESVQQATDAINLAIAQMRDDPTQGIEGDTQAVSYGGFDVTCVGATGSGAVGVNSVADRTVDCAAAKGGDARVEVKVRFLDEGGNDPGAEIEIVDRFIHD